MNAHARWLALVIVTLGSLAVACGGDSGTKVGAPAATATRPPSGPTAAASPTVAAASAAAPGGAAAQSVTVGDFNYSPSALTARPGQQVRLNVSNGGQLPHTFTIDGVVDSQVISAGASKAVEFTPAQAGTLTFYCTVHGRATMSGTLTVSATGALPAPSNAGSGATTSAPASPPPASGGYDYGY